MYFALKGRSILAQGNALGMMNNIGQPPCKGKATLGFSLALTGRLTVFGCSETQGGGEYALPWAKMCCPYRAKNTLPTVDNFVDTCCKRGKNSLRLSLESFVPVYRV